MRTGSQVTLSRRRLAATHWKQILRLGGITGALIGCLLWIYSVLCVGEARSLTSKSFLSGSLTTATTAVQLSPHDPDAYYARASTLINAGEIDLAIDDLRRAIALRSEDYKLWTELGTSLNKKGDTAGALAALREAEARAPFYAQPHWKAGLLLQELSRRDEAFKEFRAAASTQPALLPKVIEMAWVEYARDCESVQAAVEPRTDRERLILAHFFIANGKANDALSLVLSVNNLSYYERRQLLVEFLDRRQYAVAYEFWAKTGGNNLRRVQVGTIEDGGFESSHLSGEVGFAWRVNEVASFNVTIDNGAGANGKRSLRIDWKGNSDPAEEVVSQLILVEPNARYQLRFAARTQELVTGGAPVLTVTDISERNEKRIASSHTMPVGTSDWQYIHLDFTTASSTSAIRIGVQRESCPQHPCRIFGTLWLDDFSLSKI